MLPAIILALVCGTPSGWGADSLDCRLEDQGRPQRIVQARLYRALCGGTGWPVLVDSLPATAGIEVCFTADTSVCVTYFMTAVNAAGMESCKAAISFPRVVGVGYPVGAAPESREWYFDLSGRRLPRQPDTPGLYWLKQPGKKPKRIVVL